MKSLTKKLMNTKKEGKTIMSVFTDTLKKAEDHKGKLQVIEAELVAEMNVVQEVLKDTRDEGKKTEHVINELNKILGN